MSLISAAAAVSTFTTPSIPWGSLTPVLIVVGAAVLGILVEGFAPVAARRPTNIALSLLATLAAAIVLAARWGRVVHAPVASGEYVEDPLTVAVQTVLVGVSFLAILVVADRTQVRDGAFAGQPADRPGSAEERRTITRGYQRSEMFPLTLLSVGGMMLFPAADSLITLFIALELLSLPLYVLSATARRRRQLSYEAAVKYFILGAFSSAFFVMGAALLYGYSGSVQLSAISTALPQTSGMDWLALAGAFLVMVGLLFKIGAAPFHAWTPDVYTGAPTPVTGFMAAAVKISVFGALLRFYQTIAGRLSWDLLPILIGVAILTMVIGTVGGVVQGDVKRMLAYSSISHAGFMLIAVLSLVKGSAASTIFYTIAYGLATVGAFGVVTLVRSSDAQGDIGGEETSIQRWAGLGRTSPWLAGSMLVFLLSFAGIPLTSGFVGKFLVFSNGFAGNLGWVVAIALAASAVTAFYYFRLALLMFFTPPDGATKVVKSEGLTAVSIGVCAVGTLALGIFPNPVLSLLNQVVIYLP